MTLIEVLVTLAIVAVMSTIVMLGLGVSGRGANAQTEANRLAQQLGGAVDEALVTRRPMALSWDDRGYGFVVQDAAGLWVTDPRPAFGVRHVLPHGLALSGDAPALLVITGDGPGTHSTLSIADARRTVWTVAFDGLNAATTAGAA